MEKKNTISRFAVWFIGLILMGSLASCLKDKDTIYPQAFLTMVNGYVSTPSVMYSADNNNIHTNYNPLLYKGYNFTYLFPGSRRIRIFSPTNTTLADDTYSFRDSTYYTSFVYGTAENVSHFIVEDKLIQNIHNRSAVRFYHLSPSEGSLNVYLDDTGNPLRENIHYATEAALAQSDIAEFVAIESGTHTIIVQNDEHETLITREFKFEKGIHYSIILIGESNSETTPLYIGVVTQYR